jgi:hypothetical protein
VLTIQLSQGKLLGGFTDCTSPGDAANVKDSCEQTLDGQAKIRFIVPKALHN